MEFDNIDAEEIGIEVFKGQPEKTIIGYNSKLKKLFIDRSQSGNVDFHNDFTSVDYASYELRDKSLKLEILVDQSIVEVFAGNGSVVISDQVFPNSELNGMQLYVKEGIARLRNLEVYKLK